MIGQEAGTNDNPKGKGKDAKGKEKDNQQLPQQGAQKGAQQDPQQVPRKGTNGKGLGPMHLMETI